MLMWLTCVAFLIFIPAAIFIDGKKISESDLVRLKDLILSKNSSIQPGGKGRFRSIDFTFTNTGYRFRITEEEYQCVSDKEILSNFKEGDTISIKLKKSDQSNFFSVNWFNKSSTIYGLSKKGIEYLTLRCRNQVNSKWIKAATIASTVAVILAFIFAMIVLKPKTKRDAFGQFPINPFIVVAIAWLIVYFNLR